jgi:hypothetical protein
VVQFHPGAPILLKIKMKKTIISHFYNEEYLLPWWLDHHRNIFDHGVMVNYHSTDRSVDIIKNMCPSWEIVDTKNEYFSALALDEEVSYFESTIESGWKIALNTTEFLLGDLNVLNTIPSTHKNIFHGRSITEVKSGYGLPSIIMVDLDQDKIIDYTKPLLLQKQHGILHNQGAFEIRPGRLIHCEKSMYYPPAGRHWNYTTEDLVVLWYGFSPYNEAIKARKMQIKYKMPESDIKKGWGYQHLWSDQQMDHVYLNYRNSAKDLSHYINNLYAKMNSGL